MCCNCALLERLHPGQTLTERMRDGVPLESMNPSSFSIRSLATLIIIDTARSILWYRYIESSAISSRRLTHIPRMEPLSKQPLAALPALKWSTTPLPSSAAGGRSTASRNPPSHHAVSEPPSSALPMPPVLRQNNPAARPSTNTLSYTNSPVDHVSPVHHQVSKTVVPSHNIPPVAHNIMSLVQPQVPKTKTMASPGARPMNAPPSLNMNAPSPTTTTTTKATPSSSSAPRPSAGVPRPSPVNDLLLPLSLLTPMPGAEDLHLVSPSAAALRAISLQSPAHARPRNSPTPGPRSAQSHRVDFDPASVSAAIGSMFPSLTLQPIVQGGGLMTSYGALRQEIRGTGTASGPASFSASAYGAGKEGYAHRAAMKAVSEDRLPPGAMILPGGGSFEEGGDLPDGWDLKERPQGLMNLIQEEGGTKSVTGWTHHPFILPAKESHPPQVKQKQAQSGSYASRASERSHREGPPAAKSSGSSGNLQVLASKSSSNSLSSDPPPPASAPRPKPAAVPSQVPRTVASNEATRPPGSVAAASIQATGTKQPPVK